MNPVKEWYTQQAWMQGIQVKAHPSVDVNQFYRQFHAHPDLWKAAFYFLKMDLSSMEVGKYPLVGDEAIAIVSEYQSKAPENAKWEAHRKYIDLQYVISGQEQMGILPLEQAVSPLEYNATKDVVFFEDNDGDYFIATADVFFLFFPTDVHRPGIRVNESTPVKKLVIKILST